MSPRPQDHHSRVGRQRLPTRTWRILGGIVLLIGSGIAWWLAGRGTPPVIPIPNIPLEGSPAMVAKTISRAVETVERQPDSGEAWGYLGMLLFAHQFEFEANQCFEQAQILAPDDFRWPYLLGLNLSVSDREAAADCWRRAVRLNNDFGVAHCRLGELLIELGEWAEAESHLRMAQRLQPSQVRPQLALARLSQLRGQFQEAFALASGAVRLEPGERSTHELLAKLHQQMGNDEAALEEMKIAESLPNSPLSWHDPVAADVVQLRQDSGWHLARAQSLLAEGRWAEGVEVLYEAVDHDDQDPRVVSALGRALVQTQRINEAQAVLLKASRRHLDSAEVWFQLGVAYFYGDRFAEATSSFQAAIRLKPDYTLAHFNLGLALERQGDANGALSAFQRAADYRPAYAAAHTNAGRILLDQGRPNEALEHLGQSVRLDPRDRNAQDLFERASASASR